MLNGHGDDAYQYNRTIVSNFSSNVYNQNDLSGLKAFLKEELEHIVSYPHPEAASLQQDLAEVNHILPENVCVTNGSVESIYLIAQLFQNKRSAIIVPTFSEYADACHIYHHQIEMLHSLENPDSFDLIWLCNPNNPTGKVYDKTYLKGLIRQYPDVLFVLDHAYEAFTLQPLLSSEEAAAFPNVILLHSMTKRFAIPGLRLGYITANNNLIGQLRQLRMPWSVNSMAIAAGHYLLERNMPFDIVAYLNEKDHLYKSLQTIGDLEMIPSDTHFMLVRLCRGNAADLKDFLANKYGMLIRDASNFQGLDESYIRIATQTSAENDALVQGIRDWFSSF